MAVRTTHAASVVRLCASLLFGDNALHILDRHLFMCAASTLKNVTLLGVRPRCTSGVTLQDDPWHRSRLMLAIIDSSGECVW